MSTSGYSRVLYVGPELREGVATQGFRQHLQALAGEQVLDDIVDTASGFETLWQTVSETLRSIPGNLLLIDLDPGADSAYLNWLRSELQRIAEPLAGVARVFVSGSLLARRELSAATAHALIAQPAEHLPCTGVDAIPAKPDWSRIPAHRHQLFLCIGARCVRRGALPLWKRLRQQLAAADCLEQPDGVLITRTYCQYPCNRGPIATVHPAGHWYSITCNEDVDRLVSEQLLEHRPASAQLIARE